MKEKKEERKIGKPMVKKNTCQLLNNDKFNLKKSFEQTNNPKAVRCYSTKLVINFVPKLKPKKSFCRPTHLQLNKDDDNENEKSFELDKISSCDDDESKNSSSMSCSSDNEIEKEDKNNNNKTIKKCNFTLDNNIKNTDNSEQNLNNEDILSDTKKKKKSSADEYENLTYKKKKSMKITMDETETKDNNFIKNIRKEMTKIKSKTHFMKYKETEEKINQKMKNDFNLGKKNSSLDSDNEKENNKQNNESKKKTSLTDKKHISNKNFSILDILAFKNKKIEI